MGTVATFLLSPSLDGQEATGDSAWDWQLTGWIGGATERFEERLPLSPQLSLRLDGTPGGGIGVGVEASTRFVSERLDCPAMVGVECDSTGLVPTPVFSVAGQYHVLSERAVRPYGLALAGINLGSTSRVLGLGVGARAVRVVADRSIYGEIRYRRDNRFELTRQDHWEFMVGLDLWR